MADKNVVDDYYSNISGKENEGDKKNDKKHQNCLFKTLSSSAARATAPEKRVFPEFS